MGYPFFIVGKEWVKAEEPGVGDVSKTGKGTLRIAKAHVDPHSEEVYNFQVAENHTYLVTDQGVECATWIRNHERIFQPVAQGFSPQETEDVSVMSEDTTTATNEVPPGKPLTVSKTGGRWEFHHQDTELVEQQMLRLINDPHAYDDLHYQGPTRLPWNWQSDSTLRAQQRNAESRKLQELINAAGRLKTVEIAGGNSNFFCQSEARGYGRDALEKYERQRDAIVQKYIRDSSVRWGNLNWNGP